MRPKTIVKRRKNHHLKSRDAKKVKKEKKVEKKSSSLDDELDGLVDFVDNEILLPSEVRKFKKKQIKRQPQKELYGDQGNNLKMPKKGHHVHFEPSLSGNFDDEVEAADNKTLSTKCRGLINRLTSQTMAFVTSEFEKLYSSNPRQAMDAILFQIINEMVVRPETITKRRLVAELMLLISYLSHTINPGIGASFIHKMIQKFESVYTSDAEVQNKSLENMVNCLNNLFIIGLVEPSFIFQLAKRINSGPFNQKSVELLLFLLRGVGFQLRKDGSLMRILITETQENCKKLVDPDGRTSFMIEALTAIKNNNVNKLNNYGCDIDRDLIESTLKSLIQRPKLAEPLNKASYEEILRSSNWYLLEHARVHDQIDETTNDPQNTKPTLSKQVIYICKMLKLVKQSEKNIFDALTKASDYNEAYTTIISFGNQVSSDAIHVCVKAAIYEKRYNTYYLKIIQNLCHHDRPYKISTKFIIQDTLRNVHNLEKSQIDNFQKLTLDLIQSKAIPITILKSVQWGKIDEKMTSFLKYLLENLNNLPDKERVDIMKKNDKTGAYLNGLKTFCRCFLDNCKLFG